MKRKSLELKRRKGHYMPWCADPIEALFKEWHGRDGGGEVIASLLPEAESVGDAMDRVMASLVTPENIDLAEIRGHWREIAGSEAAKCTSPASFKNKILTVEVAQGSSLMELNMTCKSRIISTLRTRYGPAFCKNVRFRNAG